MHTALYRKMRPNKFSSVVGQEAIVTTLRNQLRSGHVSHAYLLCGTRGTGKTSTAKIFARAVNCPGAAQSGEPCNDCESCLDILADRSLSVIEIDAASNNGVDNIRDLREEAKYPPSSGIYKVYIIDEAHMLTTAAFNALLKTLEEPPGHVIFILATTDPGKIPATILSRCQRYDFKRISRDIMIDTLASYMENEDVSAKQDALEYIASVSDGAMRDALSILDQCLSLYNEESITLEKVQSLLGAVDQTALFDYVDCLVKADASAALAIIAQAAKEGRDLSRFTSDIITHLRNVLVAAQISDHTDILDYAHETVERYRRQGAGVDPNILIGYIQEFSELQNQMRYLPQERLALEVCTIKLCTQNTRPSPTPTPLPIPIPAQTDEAVSAPLPKAEAVSAPLPKAQAPPSPTPKVDSVSNITEGWQNFCAGLSMMLKPMLSLCEVECSGSDIKINCRNSGNLQYMQDNKNQIAAEITSYFKLQEDPIIVFMADDSYNNTDTFKESIRTQINMPVEFE